jgi:lipoate-protein ligase A
MTDTWRFIESGPCPAAYNMALDEAIAVAVRKNTVPPTLRIYGWNAPSVSIGYFQRIADIDTEYCFENHMPIVRRMTGGRAIFHGDDITYGFSVKTLSGLFSGGLLDSYKKISIALSLALTRIGLSPESKCVRGNRRSSSSSPRNPFCFQAISFGEIAINGRKIVGSAQKRWTDGLLQQGSVPFLVDSEKVTRIFKLNSLQEIEESTAGLKEISPAIEYATFKDAVSISFEETFGIKFLSSSPSHGEISIARELEAQKYLSHEWTFRR